MLQTINDFLADAETGNAEAQFKAGMCYHIGTYGATQDLRKAAKWYALASEQGHVKATFYLGNLYRTGSGVAQSYERAAECYRKAAGKGDDNAKVHLGMLCENGQGVPKSRERAEALYREAAANGNAEAEELLNKLLNAHDDINKNNEKLPQNNREFPRWLKVSVFALGGLAVILAGIFLVLTFWPFGKLEINDIAAKVMPATVLINVETKNGGAHGSGFFAETGKVFTNAHVVEGARAIAIKTHTGKSYVAEILDINRELDLAVLTVNADRRDYSVLKFAKAVPEPGSEIVVIGSPLGYEQTVSGGLVSAVRHYDNDITVLQITAPISPGSSGSPVVNMRGEVVGVATMTNTAGQSLNFAVSVQSTRRTFSANDVYLIENDVPIAERDGAVYELRDRGPTALDLRPKSPAGESAKVIETRHLEVRTLAKVRSVSSGRTYWIDSSSVKKPVAMTLAGFVEKFNDSSRIGSARINAGDFRVHEDTAILKRGENGIILKFGQDGHTISTVLVAISLDDMAGSIHPWLEQTINVFYPVPIISTTDFYGSLTRYRAGLMAAGDVKKFPIKFTMLFSPEVAMLSLEFNKNTP